MLTTNNVSIGGHLFVCDECGATYPSSRQRIRWDNAVVCDKHFEHRNPLDYIKSVAETSIVNDARTSQTYSVNSCTVQGRSAIAGYAFAGCAIVGLVPGI